ncbi:MAG: hypothetical protein A2218_10235 [Elusimicrobia bacterium RIFOXYA2_FULL_53_38]|nr:MAG: hypothetical protein A2218_10235 [Elusimicrobia bacterium RIFOXYA2_FULL_53_38]
MPKSCLKHKKVDLFHFALYIRIMETQNTPAVNSKNTSPEERLDALANVLAEGIAYLGERGLLDFALAPSSDLPIPPKEAINPNVTERP